MSDELEILKEQADALGITYHPAIGLAKLQEKINEAQVIAYPLDEEPEVKPIEIKKPVPETEVQKRHRLKKELTKLIRVRVTCMNPAKKELTGQLFDVGNSFIPAQRLFVPFDVEDGWHVPQIVLNSMYECKCQIFVNVTDHRGNKTRKGKLIKEFAIEILPPLTQKELDELAAVQAATKSLQD